MMKSFDQIYQRAVLRKGGEKELQSLLPDIKSQQQLADQTNDRVLALMTQCIFQAGFAWKVVIDKWSGFEEVFKGFNPAALQFLSAEELEEIAKDTRIIRNMQKIVTVPHNAQWIEEVSAEYGSFSKFISEWPSNNLVELFQLLKKRGARLGGNTGQRVLRLLGVDGFILSKDVVQALHHADIDFYGSASSLKDLRLIQAAFNHWHQETQLPYTHLSKILSFSEGENISTQTLLER